LEVGNGWEIALEVKNEVNGGSSIMLINYDYVPIKHKFCLKVFHHVKDCLTLAKAKVGTKKINEQGGLDWLKRKIHGIILMRETSSPKKRTHGRCMVKWFIFGIFYTP
jgi:hypothetical protein